MFKDDGECLLLILSGREKEGKEALVFAVSGAQYPFSGSQGKDLVKEPASPCVMMSDLPQSVSCTCRFTPVYYLY